MGVPILAVGLCGPASASGNPGTVWHSCSPTSSANACEEAMRRALASDITWQPAELRLTEEQNAAQHLDLGEPGASPGDTLFFDNTLLDESSAEVVGRFVSRCVQMTDAMHHCQGSLLFPDGSIELSTTTTWAVTSSQPSPAAPVYMLASPDMPGSRQRVRPA
ncbi:MAG TPA: hypothetical protein VIU11_05355 [Nakamurella sp.]